MIPPESSRKRTFTPTLIKVGVFLKPPDQEKDTAPNKDESDYHPPPSALTIEVL